MAEPQIIHSEAVAEANGKLCSSSMRWELDGDYMRCRVCQRPQLTSFARYPFPHDDGCKGAQGHEPHPWITFVRLLAPLSQAAGK